jgi:hypothetical protein
MQHGVGAGLHGHVKVGEDARVVERGGHSAQLVQNERRVGHAHAQHTAAVRRQHRQYRLQQI